MIDIQKVTSGERDIIADAVCPIMCAVEDAKDLLSGIESQYFEVRAPELDQTDVKRVALVLRVAGNMLFDACTSFSLLTGFDSFGNPEYAHKLMKQISCSKRVDKLANQLYDKEGHMGEEKQKYIRATRRKAKEMPDEQAELVLSALLKGVQ